MSALRRIVPFLVLLVASTSCARPAAFPAAADPVEARRGMVVSAHPEASKAGLEILRAGGNAVDAAVATGFALAVTFPVAGNLGGGGFLVLRQPNGAATTYDYREKAPAAATRDMYLDAEGNFVPQRSQEGHLASGVPGSVDGMLAAHARHGRLPLARVLAPAIRLAEQGFALTRGDAAMFNGYRTTFLRFPSTRKYFVKPDTSDYVAGERFRQRDLAATLRRIAAQGRNGFYTGRTARLIAEEMQRGGGLITEADLAAYRSVERAPVIGTYRGRRVITMGPPSSGGVALVQLLNAVEPYDLSAMGWNSSATVHLMGEAMRRVYADRAEFLGDPDFVRVPIAELTAKPYTLRRMQSFNPQRADSSARTTFGDPYASESSETTHFSVVDNDGQAVSVTTTINGGFGNYVVVDGAGFFLNNEMDDFSAKPGVPNMFGLVGNEANAIVPGKRMLSSMTPTIVEDEQGRLEMIVGTPGGSTIITTVFQVMLNVYAHGMNIQEAVAAPRVHHQWLPDVLRAERFALQADTRTALEGRGWTVVEGGQWGRADAILVAYDRYETGVDPSGLDPIRRQTLGRMYLGGADPRGEDTALGY
ncbi:MAG: gamma-glutamyltransferase [Bacteroidetes bacterium]|nr:gamma-glutamyltransferase [Bacteroidota bacterium]